MFFSNSKYVFFCLYVVPYTHSANILVMSPLPSVSHDAIIKNLAKGLAKKGHQVDVVSHFPLQKPINGYNDISIKSDKKSLVNTFRVDFAKNLVGISLLQSMIILGGLTSCEAAYKTLQFRQLKNSTKKYDLLIVEHFTTDCMLGWAWHFGIPTVLVTSSLLLPWNTDRFGMPDNPSYIPTYFVEYNSEMSLYERIVNTWKFMQAKFLFDYISRRPSEQIARDFFGPKMPSLNQLAYNCSLMLVNTHFSVNNARPLVPNVIEVAGLHLEDPKPLNQYLNKVLDTELRGIVYFSFGSLISAETFAAETFQELFDAFSQLPYKILMRIRIENIPKDLRIPNNIHFEAWLPQLDILCDPRVKLFISHGGMMGSQEALYCEVPILGIPIFADQKSNINHAKILGYGLMVEEITKSAILAAAKQLLYNQTYANNAKKVSAEFKDRPMTAMDTAIYWTEYVIRHKGAPRLQCAAKHLRWYQYYLIDVICIVIVVPFVVMYLLISFLRSLVNRGPTKTKVKSS